jgi:hypothetical protein
MLVVNRRKFLHSTVALLAAPAAAKALPFKPPLIGFCGCCLSGHQAALLAARARDDINPDDIVASSGDATTDRFLGMALLRLSTLFKVTPGFAFINNLDNAFATTANLTKDGPGTVLMGRVYFDNAMRDDETGMTVVSICAHEFGHIHQFMNGYHEELAALDKTARPMELHADFLAGYFLAMRKRDYPNVSLFKVGDALSKKGDTDFNNGNHHGTSEERVAAVTAGFDL